MKSESSELPPMSLCSGSDMGTSPTTANGTESPENVTIDYVIKLMESGKFPINLAFIWSHIKQQPEENHEENVRGSENYVQADNEIGVFGEGQNRSASVLERADVGRNEGGQ